MGWTAPATFSVSEIVTASKLNTHIRDNLKYLKGQAGAIAIEDTMVLANELQIYRTTGTGPSAFRIKTTDNADSSYLLFHDPTNTGRAYMRYNNPGAAAANTLDITCVDGPIALLPGTNVGIGTVAPQGKIHIVGATGRALFFDHAGFTTTPITILPAASVASFMMVFGVVISNQPAFSGSVGSTQGPGGNIDITVGADVVRIAISAGGGVTIVRNSGSNTHKCSLWMMYI